MKLFVMRHGIAVEREEWAESDEARPLTTEGIEKTRRAVRGLRVAIDGENIEWIASSASLRAHQTAKIARELLGVHPKIAIWPELEHADFAPIITRLKERAQSTLIVGHEPGLGQFTAQLLCGSAHGFKIDWKKAAVCALEVDFSNAEPNAQLLWFATPKQLRAMGKT